MLNQEAKELICKVLDLFTKSSKIPIALYEYDNYSKLVEIFRDEAQFPPHCHALWALNGGRGRTLCDQNMNERAIEGFKALEPVRCLCHAGLTNITVPIVIGGKAVAVIQYGAFLERDDSRLEDRLLRHAAAMQKLGATQSEASHIENLLRNETPKYAEGESEIRHSNLVSSLTQIITEYIEQNEQKHRIQKGAFHDLQLRLQAALAEAENLYEDQPEDSPLRRPLEDIMGTVEAGGTVLHNLTKGEYLPKEYSIDSCSILEMINRAVQLCRAEAQKKDVGLRIDIQPTDAFITASQKHIQQVFNNVLHNAVKYSYKTTSKSQERRYITVRGRMRRQGFEVMTSNFGIGIEPDEYERIFTDGYRGRLTTDESRTGSGQGLSLSKRIIEAHNGAISVSSESAGDIADDGTRPYLTRVTIWLPFKPFALSELGNGK